jgi:hypothetical protein
VFCCPKQSPNKQGGCSPRWPGFSLTVPVSQNALAHLPWPVGATDDMAAESVGAFQVGENLILVITPYNHSLQSLLPAALYDIGKYSQLRNRWQGPLWLKSIVLILRVGSGMSQLSN